MNKMQIIGNLTRDPEVRSFTDGSTVCNFTVAVNRRSDSGHPEADYFRVAVWRKLGESCAQYLAKGKKVFVEGPLRVRLYETNDGETKAELGITATSVEFLSPRAQAAEAGQAQGAPNVDEATGMPVVEEDVPF